MFDLQLMRQALSQARTLLNIFRVPSYARKDDDKDNPKKDAGERGSKEKPKNTTRRYESAKQQRDRRDDRDGKKEPELRFSKKAREREKELKKEREKESNNGKGRGYSDRDRNDGESKRSQDRTKDEEDREETAMEKKERIRKERIRNKVSWLNSFDLRYKFET